LHLCEQQAPPSHCSPASLIPFPQAEVAVLELVPVLEADLELDGVSVFEAVPDGDEVIDAAATEIDELTGDADEAAGEMDETAGEMDETAGEMDETAGEMDETAGEMDETLAEMEDTLAEMDETLAEMDDTLTEGEIPCAFAMRDWIAKKAKTNRICFIILKSY